MNIELDNIDCFYGQHQALYNISLCYPLGETIVLLGPSGAGKSSLLKVFNLLEKPVSGSMKIAELFYDFCKPINNDMVHLLRKDVGIVFQNYNLWPHLTVMENLIEAPCQVLGINKKDAMQKALGLLTRLQLSTFSERYPLHLSGGQQQRVAIARALMMEPKILLFDEPTAALDPESTSEVADIINELADSGITQIIVTHEVDFAKKVASQVIYMENGQIIEQGDATCLISPNTENLKAYLSH